MTLLKLLQCIDTSKSTPLTVQPRHGEPSDVEYVRGCVLEVVVPNFEKPPKIKSLTLTIGGEGVPLSKVFLHLMDCYKKHGDMIVLVGREVASIEKVKDNRITYYY